MAERNTQNWRRLSLSLITVLFILMALSQGASADQVNAEIGEGIALNTTGNYWVLSVDNVDVNGNKALFSLHSEGTEFDSFVLSTGDSKNYTHQGTNVVNFTLDSVFRGETSIVVLNITKPSKITYPYTRPNIKLNYTSKTLDKSITYDRYKDNIDGVTYQDVAYNASRSNTTAKNVTIENFTWRFTDGKRYTGPRLTYTFRNLNSSTRIIGKDVDIDLGNGYILKAVTPKTSLTSNDSIEFHLFNESKDNYNYNNYIKVGIKVNESSEFKFTKNSRTIVNLTVINVANYWSSYGREQQAKISFSHPSKVPINIHNYGGGRDIPVGWLTVKDSLGMSRTAPIIPRSPVFNYSNFKLKPRAIKPGQNTVMEGEVKLVGNNTLDDSIKMETELSTDGQKEWNKSFKIHPGDTKKISVDISKNKAGVYKLGLFTTSIGVGVGSHKFVRDLLVYPSGTSSSSSDSSSSGTVSGGVSAITSNEDPENYNGVVTKYLWGINAGDTVTQPLETYNLVVKRVSFNYGVAANEVKVRVEELKGPTTTLDKAPPGKIYKNFNLYVSVPDKTKMTNPALTLDVNKKWLKENNYEPNNLQLARWNNSKEKWKLHPLKVENVTKDAYSLRTTQLPGFSQYAVTVVEKEESAAKETATPTHTPTPTETPAATAKSPEENVPGLTSPAAIVALVLGVLAALAREKG